MKHMRGAPGSGDTVMRLVAHVYKGRTGEKVAGSVRCFGITIRIEPEYIQSGFATERAKIRIELYFFTHQDRGIHQHLNDHSHQLRVTALFKNGQINRGALPRAVPEAHNRSGDRNVCGGIL